MSDMAHKEGSNNLFEAVDNFEILDPETQKNLVKKAQDGDSNAREQIIMSNMKFVRAFVNKYAKLGLPIEELISEGSLGLMEAIEKYDVEKNTNFVSYASWWIKHFVERTIHKSINSVRLPMNKVRMVNSLRRHENEIRSKRHRSEEDVIDSISEEMQIPREEVVYLKTISQESVSLDREITDEGNTNYLDLIVDENEKSIDEQVEDNNAREILVNLFARIPKREAEVIKSRFGLNGEAKSLQSLSKEMGVSKERVRQIETRGLKRLKTLNEAYEHLNFAA